MSLVKPLELSDIYTRVAAWNAKRYKRTYDLKLSRSLACEEIREFKAAESEVDTLDACCDIAFVALGMIWKLDAPDKVSEAAHVAAHEANQAWYETGMPLFDGLLCALEDTTDVVSQAVELKYAMALVGLALTGMRELGLSQADCIEALSIVCNSNDTKTIVSLKPSEKGSLKGPYFVGPEYALGKLLESVGE